ncbi:MAG: SGNH/GDSL hydrolase family protein [Thermoanaerobaculia bacterium]
MKRHVVLLGDSIFDNGAYTGREPDVATHLSTLLPEWRTSLLAVDGSTISNLPDQLGGVPEDASHLVISIGGNDALLNSDLLELPARSTAEALEMFARRIADFESGYRDAIARLCGSACRPRSAPSTTATSPIPGTPGWRG